MKRFLFLLVAVVLLCVPAAAAVVPADLVLPESDFYGIHIEDNYPYRMVYFNHGSYFYIYSSSPIFVKNASYGQYGIDFTNNDAFAKSSDGSSWDYFNRLSSVDPDSFTILAANHNIYKDGDLFFRVPPTIVPSAGELTPEMVLAQVIQLTPLLLGLIVLWVGFRKGWTWLQTSLRGL